MTKENFRRRVPYTSRLAIHCLNANAIAMEPIALIVTAIAWGAAEAAKDTASQAIRDMYAGLRKVVIDHYGDYRDVVEKTSALEAQPQSQEIQTFLAQAIANSAKPIDSGMLLAAESLIEKLRDQTGPIGMKIGVLTAERFCVENVNPGQNGVGVLINQAEVKEFSIGQIGEVGLKKA